MKFGNASEMSHKNARVNLSGFSMLLNWLLPVLPPSSGVHCSPPQQHCGPRLLHCGPPLQHCGRDHGRPQLQHCRWQVELRRLRWNRLPLPIARSRNRLAALYHCELLFGEKATSAWRRCSPWWSLEGETVFDFPVFDSPEFELPEIDLPQPSPLEGQAWMAVVKGRRRRCSALVRESRLTHYRFQGIDN